MGKKNSGSNQKALFLINAIIKTQNEELAMPLSIRQSRILHKQHKKWGNEEKQRDMQLEKDRKLKGREV